MVAMVSPKPSSQPRGACGRLATRHELGVRRPGREQQRHPGREILLTALVARLSPHRNRRF
jgi:hypothetical protein